MRLQSLEFIEYEGKPQEWSITGLTLGAKNLIVGRNASGKSRAINVINGLARSLAGFQGVPLSGTFNACFRQDEKEYQYLVICNEQQVLSEKLIIDGTVVLEPVSYTHLDVYKRQL